MTAQFNNLPKRGPGRPKGSPNKVSAAAKDIIAGAADKLGGMDRLVAWAREDAANERAFWAQVYPKLLPLQVSGSLDMKHTLLETLKSGRVAAEGSE